MYFLGSFRTVKSNAKCNIYPDDNHILEGLLLVSKRNMIFQLLKRCPFQALGQVLGKQINQKYALDLKEFQPNRKDKLLF